MAEKRSLDFLPMDMEENSKRPKLELNSGEEHMSVQVEENSTHELKNENNSAVRETEVDGTCEADVSKCETEDDGACEGDLVKCETELTSDTEGNSLDTNDQTGTEGQGDTTQISTDACQDTVSAPVLPGDTSEMCDSNTGDAALLHPLSYTRTDEFTSEIFKIQIHNLPKFGFNELKKRLKSHLRLNPHKIKSDRRYVTYVCFRNETDRDEALQKINGHVWKGKTLQAKIAAPVADPYLQKRHQDKDHDVVTSAPKTKADTAHMGDGQKSIPEDAEARLRANVSPLWDVDYAEQLQIKTEKMRDVLKRVTKNSFVKHLFLNRSQPDNLACDLLPILPSPVTSEYRNKNEFTVGYGLDGQVLVGFRYGMYKDGTTAVGDSTSLGIAMPAAVPVVKSFREFVAKSKWLPYRQETGTGHWQTLTVRTFLTGDVMAVVDFVPRKLDQSDIESAKESLKEFYTDGEGKDVKITSFYFRVRGGKGETSKHSSELLLGESHVYETLLNLKFRISPEAFFQVNTAATEKLYQLICDWCNVSASTTVLDICCGTGTIGLSMAKKVKQVVGIEMCPEAVEDARVNATINDIQNATFHCAKVEDAIYKIMSSVQTLTSAEEGVAVVDPPRAGLHKDVIKTLRRCTSIQRLVYVSCNPDSALDNFVDLIRPETGRHKGSPFQMVKAVPVDLFPGTKHCELVILFTRPQVNSTHITNPANDHTHPDTRPTNDPTHPDTRPTNDPTHPDTRPTNDPTHPDTSPAMTPSDTDSNVTECRKNSSTQEHIVNNPVNDVEHRT